MENARIAISNVVLLVRVDKRKLSTLYQKFAECAVGLANQIVGTISIPVRNYNGDCSINPTSKARLEIELGPSWV